MRSCRDCGRAGRLFGVALLCFWVGSLSAAAAQSQGRSPRDATMRQRNADMMREIEMRRRDGTVREATPEQPQPHPVLPYARGKDDFRALQLVNNEMMRAVFSAGAAAPLDYERVAEATAEINKRASRLRSNLKLPEPAAEEQPRPEAIEISDDEQLKRSLRALDKSIMEFVTNPAFRNSDAVNARLSAAAAGSLTKVVELSRAVKLGAERMRKARDARSKRAGG